jgi:hypothetical protein
MSRPVVVVEMRAGHRGVSPISGPPQRGVSDLVALALVVLGLDRVSRSTVRALVIAQTGRSTSHTSGVASAFRRALRNFEQAGWVERDDHSIHVRDRDALCQWVEQGVDVDPEHARGLLQIAAAVRELKASCPNAGRRAELVALERLMQCPPSGQPGRRGVRVLGARHL